MSASVRDYEAAAIAVLVALCGPEGPEEWEPSDHDSAEAAARVAAGWVKRDGRAGAEPEPKAKRRNRPSQRTRQNRATPPGAWKLTDARKEVRERSQGNCEALTPVCTGRAAHIHHKRGRGGFDPHNPTLLLHCCSACHSYLHSHVEEAYDAGWMVKRLGVSGSMGRA